MGNISFYSTSSEDFLKLETKDPNALYFVENEGVIYRGGVAFGNKVASVDDTKEYLNIKSIDDMVIGDWEAIDYTWDNIIDKPFDNIGEGLVVNNNRLETDEIQAELAFWQSEDGTTTVRRYKHNICCLYYNSRNTPLQPAQSNIICTLPKGFCPPMGAIFPGSSGNNGEVRLNLASNGIFSGYNYTNNVLNNVYIAFTYLTLDSLPESE